MKHGTHRAYAEGCHCDICIAGNTARCRDARARRAERGRQNPDLIPHGLGGYINWECRCGVCTEANSYDVQARRARSG